MHMDAFGPMINESNMLSEGCVLPQAGEHSVSGVVGSDKQNHQGQGGDEDGRNEGPWPILISITSSIYRFFFFFFFSFSFLCFLEVAVHTNFFWNLSVTIGVNGSSLVPLDDFGSRRWSSSQRPRNLWRSAPTEEQ